MPESYVDDNFKNYLKNFKKWENVSSIYRIDIWSYWRITNFFFRYNILVVHLKKKSLLKIHTDIYIYNDMMMGICTENIRGMEGEEPVQYKWNNY